MPERPPQRTLPGRAIRVSALLAMLVLLGAGGARAAVPGGDPCDPAVFGKTLAAALGAPVEVAVGPPGMVAVVRDANGIARVRLWFGYVPGAGLTTSQAVAADTTQEDGARLVAAAIAALEPLASLASCPALRLAPEDAAIGQRLVETAAAADSRAVVGVGDVPSAFLTLEWFGDVALLVALLLALVLALPPLARGLRRPDPAALAALAVFGVALAIRLLAGPRVPIVPGNTDMTPVHAWAVRAQHGLGVLIGNAHPPLLELLAGLAFSVFGRSTEVAFLLTTVLGALTTVPVVLTGAALADGPTRTRRGLVAGILGGLALAAYPPAIFFSNGLNAEVPAGLFFALALRHTLTAATAPDGPTSGTLVRWALALVLLAHARAEGAAIAFVTLLAGLLIVVQAGGLPRLVRRPACFGALTLGATLTAPHVVRLARASLTTTADAIGTGRLAAGALVTGAGALAVLFVGWLALRFDRRLARSAGARRAWTVLVIAGAIALPLAIAATTSVHPFAPSPSTCPELPHTWFQTDHPPGVCPRDDNPLFLWEPGYFPLLFAPLFILGLLPRRVGEGPRLPVAAPLLVLLPLFVWQLTGLPGGSGVLILEGARYHVPVAAAVALLVGLGAARVHERLPDRPWLRRTAFLLAVAWCASPAVTHRVNYTDVRHDLQSEFRFAEAAVAALPDGALVLLPDQRIPLGAAWQPVSQLFHTRDLLPGIAYLQDKRIVVRGLREALAGPLASQTTYFYFGLDCYRTPAPAEVDPACAAVRDMAGTATVEARFPNRMYSGVMAETIGIRGETVRVALLPLAPDALARLARMFVTPVAGPR